MPKFHLTAAIFLSLALVASAAWVRFAPQNPALAQLQGTGTLEGANIDGSEAYFPNNEATLETATSTLSEVDVVSRQLFSDYIKLKTGNQATPETLRALADKYAEALATQQTFSSIDRSKITIVPDSNERLLEYYQKLLTLREKHKKTLDGVQPEEQFDDLFSPKLKNFMLSASNEYSLIASEIMALPVPASLAEEHLKLVNNYLAGSEITRTISEIDKNPVSALTSLESLVKNGDDEERLVAEMKVTLLSRGFPPSSL